MLNLPQAFMEIMKKQLPEKEWEAFFAVYQKPPYKGVRLNPLKGDRYALTSLLPFLGQPVPWEENGFLVSVEKIGASPYHHAGLIYSQEPSAMSASPLLDVKPGEKVLDLCSAPGGKGTQLACKMAGEGVIVLNEPVFNRAKILSSNVERLGIQNAVVTSEYPERLAQIFVEYFDKILVDAPCSGEGMFRKNTEEALGEWSEQNVELCVKRQSFILDQAVKMLKVGGRLVYSTCTFNEKEDEGQVCDHLKNHPEMKLIQQEKLYPHKVQGEGHFVALLEKTYSTETEKTVKRIKPNISKGNEKIYRGFEQTFTTLRFENLYEVGSVLYALPKDCFDFKPFQVLRAGVRLGEVKNGRFEPDHSLCMCLKKEECKKVVDLKETDNRVQKYLRGETLEYNIDGWCVVCIEGYPLGLGKGVNGIVKNHLPKALRLAQ